jgi:hypothetical protein
MGNTFAFFQPRSSSLPKKKNTITFIDSDCNLNVSYPCLHKVHIRFQENECAQEARWKGDDIWKYLERNKDQSKETKRLYEKWKEHFIIYGEYSLTHGTTTAAITDTTADTTTAATTTTTTATAAAHRNRECCQIPFFSSFF